MTVSRARLDAIRERLSESADLTEKALDFMADPEQVEEAKADIALWREAASLLAELERVSAANTTLTEAIDAAIEDIESDVFLYGADVHTADLCITAVVATKERLKAALTVVARAAHEEGE